MRGTILLNHDENTKQVEEEEKSRFLRNLLDQMFENTEVIDRIAEIWSEDKPMEPEQKVKMRGIFNTFSIQVIDDLDGQMQIFVEGEKIGEWLKCKYKLKRDMAQRDRRKQFFLEMEVNCWSVFENTETQETE